MPSLPEKKTLAKGAILAAATEMAQAEGGFGLSVDKVSRQARISKGGFFYHFATKESMIEAVLQRKLDEFGQRVEGHVGRGRQFPQALFEAIFEEIAQNVPMMASVNAALAFGDTFARVVTERRKAWMDRLAAEVRPATRARLTGLAFDGLLFSCSLNRTPPSKSDIDRLKKAIRELLA